MLEEYHKMKSNEPLRTLILRGHRVDIVQAHPYEALRGVRRLLTSGADLRQPFEETWHAETIPAGSEVTPTNCIRKVCLDIGWTLELSVDLCGFRSSSNTLDWGR